MYTLSLILFVYSLIMAVLFNSKLSKHYLKFPYFLVFVSLSWFVSLNVDILSRDYLNYSVWFSEIRKYSLIDILLLNGVDSGKDFGFQFLVALIQKNIDYSNYVIYFIFSFLIIFLKYKISSFFNSNLILILVFWLFFAQTFILFEITQIRAGLAICLSTYAFLRSIHYKGNNLLNILIFLIAISIHISTVLIFLIFLIYKFREEIVSKYFIILLILSSLIFKYLFSTFISLLFIKYFSDSIRFSDYLDGSEVLSLLSVFLIAKILVILILLFYWDEIAETKKYIVLMSAIGCFFQISLSSNAVFGLRFAELFILFSLMTFVMPLLIKSININLRYIYLICLLGLSFFFYYSSTKIILS